MQLTSELGLADALQVKNLDAMALQTFLTPHVSGLYALCGPDSPARADAITGEDVSRLIDLLAQEFRFVIVDTAPGLTEHTLAVFDLATDAVLVAGMDVPSIRGRGEFSRQGGVVRRSFPSAQAPDQTRQVRITGQP